MSTQCDFELLLDARLELPNLEEILIEADGPCSYGAVKALINRLNASVAQQWERADLVECLGLWLKLLLNRSCVLLAHRRVALLEFFNLSLKIFLQ